MHDALDVQRDHARLIADCLSLLGDGGELLFSTNLRGFDFQASRQGAGVPRHHRTDHSRGLPQQEDSPLLLCCPSLLSAALGKRNRIRLLKETGAESAG